MPVTLPATHLDDASLQWDLGSCTIRASRQLGLWVLEYPGASGPVAVRREPRVELQLATTEAVAHLTQPLSVGAHGQATLWLSWPLQVALFVEDELVETLRPGMRKTLLGPVEDGRILPATRCPLLEDPSSAPRHHAALKVTVTNRDASRVMLRRIPIDEGALRMAQSDTGVCAGTVEVTIHDATRADARVSSLKVPKGFTASQRPPSPERRHGLKLDWLLEATRRSTEFQF